MYTENCKAITKSIKRCNDKLKKTRKCNYIKWPTKIIKAEKLLEDKIKKKEQGQLKENNTRDAAINLSIQKLIYCAIDSYNSMVCVYHINFLVVVKYTK